MRKAFGLIQALIVIVLISGIMAIAMKYAQISVKQTGDSYVRESAELFMESAIEAALLAISGYDRATGCLHEVNVTSSDNRFFADINITQYFLYEGKDGLNPCDRNVSMKTEESHGMVMLELRVRTNASNAKNEGKNIRLTRRTLQRP